MLRHVIPVALVALTLLGSLPVASFAAEPPRIVSEDVSLDRRVLAVRLPGRLAEVDLRALAHNLHKTGKLTRDRTLIRFYLGTSPLDTTPWAVAAFQPDLKITFPGLTLEEEQALVAELASDRRTLLGAWLTAPPAVAGRVAIFRDKGTVFAEWRLRNGLKTVDELVESRSGRGHRYDVKGESRGHFVVTPQGDLELREGDTLVATGERITVPRAAPLPVAARVPAGPVAGPGAGSGAVQVGAGQAAANGRAGAATGPDAGSALPVTATPPAASLDRKRSVARTPAAPKVQQTAVRRDEGPIMRMPGQ